MEYFHRLLEQFTAWYAAAQISRETGPRLRRTCIWSAAHKVPDNGMAIAGGNMAGDDRNDFRIDALGVYSVFPSWPLGLKLLSSSFFGAYDGVFMIMYPPANPKIKSGDHAAINGGSWLTLPMASNRLEVRT